MRAPAILSILRPHNMIASALAVAAGACVAGNAAAPGLAFAALLAALVTGGGNVLNDYFDLPVDRINKPHRPLPSGRIGARTALVVYALVTILAMAGALIWIPRPVALLIVTWQVALAVYARWCKRWLVAGNLLVAAVSSSAFFAGAMLAGNARAGIIPAAIAFAFVLCREIVKGAEDLEGDRQGGVHTLAVVLGAPRAGTLAAALMLALAALLPVPALVADYHPGYIVLMELIVMPVLLSGAARVAGSADRNDYTRTTRALKLGMFVGIAAIALGA